MLDQTETATSPVPEDVGNIEGRDDGWWWSCGTCPTTADDPAGSFLDAWADGLRAHLEEAHDWQPEPDAMADCRCGRGPVAVLIGMTACCSRCALEHYDRRPEYTGETLTITPREDVRAAVLAAAGLTDERAPIPPPITIRVRRDFDDKWAASWPSGLVAAGGSPGAGRHETRGVLIAAIQAAGWRIVDQDGETVRVTNPHRCVECATVVQGPRGRCRECDSPHLVRAVEVSA